MKGQLPFGTQHFNCQPHEMITHTQQQLKNCLSVFVHFVGLTLKGLASRQRMQHDVQTKNDHEQQAHRRVYEDTG